MKSYRSTLMKFCVFGAAMAFAHCHKDGGNVSSGKGGRGRGGPIPVKVVEVDKKLSARKVYAVAALAGRDQADVFTKVLGRISFMGAKEGEAVRANQILFRVDRSDPGETYLHVPIVSPISGWVGRWHIANIGEQVGPTDPVVTIVDDRLLRSVAYLPADDWLEVTPATKVTATVGAFQRDAKILTIARAADLTSGRGSVTLELQNENRDWRAGMYARFAFELSPRERLLISSAALIITDNGAFVYTVDGEAAKRVPVKFTVVDGDTVEIVQGIAPKSRIVVAGANLLGDKSAIKIVE